MKKDAKIKSRLDEDVACYQMACIIKLLLALNLVELAIIIFLLW
jgi:hypothetical protein